MRSLAALLLLVVVCACQKPDFYDAAGNGHRFDDLRGKWLIVNYWATWCGPCIKEIPELNKLAKERVDEVAVFGVDYDAPRGDQLDREIRKMKIQFPVFSADPATRLGIERPEVLPTTFVFSPSGELVKTLVGPQTQDTLLAVIGE